MKRFTDTEKWSKPWFRKLPAKLKCFWCYVCDKCDLAGVWTVDMELASFSIGEAVTEQEALMAVGDRVKILDNQHWWLVGFVAFQYGELKANSNPHIAVSKRLSTLGLPLRNPSPTLPRRVQDQVQDQEGQPLAGNNHLDKLEPWQLNLDIDRVKRLLADEQDRRNSNPELCRSYYADLEALKSEKRRRAPPRKPSKPTQKPEYPNGNAVTPKSLEELAKLKQAVK